MTAEINPTGAYRAAVAALVADVDPLDPFDSLATALDGVAAQMDAQQAAAPAFAPMLEASSSALRMIAIPALRECARLDRHDWQPIEEAGR